MRERENRGKDGKRWEKREIDKRVRGKERKRKKMAREKRG